MSPNYQCCPSHCLLPETGQCADCICLHLWLKENGESLTIQKLRSTRTDPSFFHLLCFVNNSWRGVCCGWPCLYGIREKTYRKKQCQAHVFEVAHDDRLKRENVPIILQTAMLSRPTDRSTFLGCGRTRLGDSNDKKAWLEASLTTEVQGVRSQRIRSSAQLIALYVQHRKTSMCCWQSDKGDVHIISRTRQHGHAKFSRGAIRDLCCWVWPGQARCLDIVNTENTSQNAEETEPLHNSLRTPLDMMPDHASFSMKLKGGSTRRYVTFYWRSQAGAWDSV